MSRKPTRAVVAGVLLAFVGSVVTADPAAAATGTVTCTGSSTISYQPGLTNTPRDVHYVETDDFSPCLSTDATLTAGGMSAAIDFEDASCTHLPGVFEAPGSVIEWNNGGVSVIDLTFTDTIVLGTEQVTGVGPIVDGQFEGGVATIVWIYPVLNPLACLTSQGVTSQSGIVLVQVVQA